MANFKTHIVSGVVISGLASTVALAAALISPADAIALTLAGTIGGILPDIDLESSRQSKYMFGSLGVFFAFIIMFEYSQFLSIAELWVLWVSIYVLFRYILWKAFHGYTVHRGIFHSLLAVAFFGCLGVLTFDKFLHSSSTVSWLGGSFVMLGCLVHLLLDEIYSVDFANNRVKRSFGTAIKLFDYRHPVNSLALLAVVGALYSFTPSSTQFFEVVSTKDNWLYLQDRLLPKNGKWFNLEAFRLTKVGSSCDGVSRKETGCPAKKDIVYTVLYVK